jgi:hypothetical protein
MARATTAGPLKAQNDPCAHPIFPAPPAASTANISEPATDRRRGPTNRQAAENLATPPPLPPGPRPPSLGPAPQPPGRPAATSLHGAASARGGPSRPPCGPTCSPPCDSCGVASPRTRRRGARSTLPAAMAAALFAAALVCWAAGLTGAAAAPGSPEPHSASRMPAAGGRGPSLPGAAQLARVSGLAGAAAWACSAADGRWRGRGRRIVAGRRRPHPAVESESAGDGGQGHAAVGTARAEWEVVGDGGRAVPAEQV